MCGVFVRKGLGSLWLGSSLQCDSHWVWSTSPAFKTAFKEVAQATSTRQHYPQVILVLPLSQALLDLLARVQLATPSQPQTLRMDVNTPQRDARERLSGACGRMIRLCNHGSGRHGLITAFHDINLPWFYCGHDSTSKQEAPKYKHCAEKSAPPCAINSLCARFSAATVSIRI